MAVSPKEDARSTRMLRARCNGRGQSRSGADAVCACAACLGRAEALLGGTELASRLGQRLGAGRGVAFPVESASALERGFRLDGLVAAREGGHGRGRLDVVLRELLDGIAGFGGGWGWAR